LTPSLAPPSDEIRANLQGRVVWLAIAMMVSARLWLGGAESNGTRHLPDSADCSPHPCLCLASALAPGYRWAVHLPEVPPPGFSDTANTTGGGVGRAFSLGLTWSSARW
ncbi:MAG: hypothetical protein ACPLRM_00695, partial [Anaerolineae bacterium]